MSADSNFNLFKKDQGTKRPRFENHKVTIEQTISNEDDWKPVPFKPKKRRRKQVCFGCEYGPTDPDDSHPALKGLWKLFSENFGSTSNECLAEMMHDFFMAEILKPMQEQGHDIEEWTIEQIVEHIETHIVEPTINNANSIRNLQLVEKILLDQVKLENNEGQNKIDLKVLKGILDVQKQIQTLYNAKCTRQLFYSNKFKLDDSRANQDK